MNYIKRYTVKNFHSIKNEVTVDLSASSYTIEQHPYRVFTDSKGTKSYSKLKVFYGSNASGKTSLLRALVHTAYLASNQSDKAISAFKNIYNLESPSFVEIDFKCSGIDFRYKLTFNSEDLELTGIADEVLLSLSDEQSEPVVLIDRKNQVFKNLEGEDIKGLLFAKVPDYRSLLVESLTRDESYEDLFNFLRNLAFLSNIDGPYSVRFDQEGRHNLMMINAFCKQENAIDRIGKKISAEDKQEFQRFLFPFLQGLGIDIVSGHADIQVDEKENSVECDFTMMHSIDPSKPLDFRLESSGTKKLIAILYDIYYAEKTGSVMIVDELDSVLHPMLVPAINILAAKNNVQLLYTTHNLHNLKFLYNDEILLIDKDPQHNTTIQDVKDHPGYENFAILYEENQLGGVPKIGELNFSLSQ